VSAGKAGVQERSQAQETITALRTALANLDAQRDDLVAQVDGQAEEMAALQASRGDLDGQISQLVREVERWRFEAEAARGEVETRAQEVSAATSSLARASASRDELAAELALLRKERGAVLEDLTVMTQENQALHEEVSQWQSKSASLQHAALSSEKRVEAGAVSAKQLEVERDDVLRLYRQLAQEKERMGVAIQALTAERDNLRVTQADAQSALAAAQAEAESAALLARAKELDVAALKAQLSEVTSRLDSSAVSGAEAGASAQVAQRDVASLTAQLRSNDDMRLQLERALSLAQAQQTTVAEKLTARDAEIAQLRAAVLQERERCAGLERLLADLRTAPVRGEEGLARTVSQQYAVIGQMDAELTQLQQENAGLRQQLRPTADTSGTQGSPQASRDTGES